MKLTYFSGEQPNFGDELNKVIWKKILPSGFFDDNDSELFLGIGSILWDDYPKNAIKHVMGSGFGGYTKAPDVKDGSWNIVWLRGPLTAATLGVDPSLAITDSAVLLRLTPLPDPANDIDVAFMPHFQSIARGNWEEACRLAGITFLDPRAEPEELIAKIRGARLILTEAMHGAIVADALRTPFIPFLPIRSEHRMKWDDWSQSLDLDLNKQLLQSSTIAELYIRHSGSKGVGPFSNFLSSNSITSYFSKYFTLRAAENLKKVADNAYPILSKDASIERATDRCFTALNNFYPMVGNRN